MRILIVSTIYFKQVTVRGHHFVAHQYFTVTYCNHCQLIIRGIGPQGYQCTSELIFSVIFKLYLIIYLF